MNDFFSKNQYLVFSSENSESEKNSSFNAENSDTVSKSSVNSYNHYHDKEWQGPNRDDVVDIQSPTTDVNKKLYKNRETEFFIYN